MILNSDLTDQLNIAVVWDAVSNAVTQELYNSSKRAVGYSARLLINNTTEIIKDCRFTIQMKLKTYEFK